MPTLQRALLAMVMLAMLSSVACKKSSPQEPLRVDEAEYEKPEIKPSVSTPLTRQQLEYQQSAREAITSENAVKVLADMEQEIQSEIDELQATFDELELELPED
ncbi:hypothetical protein DL240_01350 [Lujinxingia litoralis]|uniref:Uncharacterized protein n=1 Tax=Lujinxingia litoralis TaxID=2211119 RepID=A0A328CDS1_9DELT|nr:hypothetical protein [Lujinxingia litoralis]RAL24883.1 hypothetical protein DL240_01350 [Lujinxingia litoralis]